MSEDSESDDDSLGSSLSESPEDELFPNSGIWAKCWCDNTLLYICFIQNG